jgi:TM2 domain-containing membrane protein YozV
MLLFCNLTFASDSTLIDTSYQHHRKKAAMMSLILPGLGQFYNEKGHRKVQGRKNISWWRAPIIWTAMGTTAYFAYFNGKEAQKLKQEWLYRQDHPNDYLFLNYSTLGTDALINGGTQTFGFVQHAKWRDYNVFGFMLIYGLNMLDAYVDAHFVTFDVSQNLNLTFQPKIYQNNQYGLALQLNFN